MIIMPVALPIEHNAAEWYTRAFGASPLMVSSNQEKGALSTFKHHTSFTDYWPVLPPNTKRYGFINTTVWPYLLPGVVPITGTIIHYAICSPFLRSNRYRSSDAKLPPPVAPPYTIIWSESTAQLEWAALGDGAIPEPSNFYHFAVIMHRIYMSPVMTYFPVSPVAPPKRTTLDFETYVIVWPKRASGTSPNVLKGSTRPVNDPLSLSSIFDLYILIFLLVKRL